MVNFGRIPPRSLEAEGVASLLSPKCRVFYDTLFSAAHIGRVSDLLAAKLRQSGLDELKLRAVLLFSFYEAFRSELDPADASPKGILSSPLTIECGIDEEKVAVGVSFFLPESSQFKTEDLSQRISERRPEGSFESLISMIHENSDYTVLKHSSASEGRRRIELISLLAIPDKMDLPARQPLHLVQIGSQTEPAREERPQAKEYIQLGDLNYLELLKEEKRKLSSAGQKFSNGEFLAKTFKQEPVMPEKRVRIKRDKEPDDELVHIREDEPELEPGGELEPAPKLVPKNKKKFSVKQAFGKVWPFGREDSEEETEDPVTDENQARKDEETSPLFPQAIESATAEIDEALEPEASDQESHSERKKAQLALPSESEPLPDFDPSDFKSMSQYLMDDFSSGNFAKIVSRAQAKSHELSKQGSTDEATLEWAAALSRDMLAEKARIVDLAKQLSQAVRQKEHEIQSREQSFSEDLRRKDEVIAQKSTALARVKEQMHGVTAQLEKQKMSSRAQAGEEAGFKQKYQLAQKILSGLREENDRLASTIEKLKEETVALQRAHKGPDLEAQAELGALKLKYEQLNRHFTQIKSVNEQLLKRMHHESQKKVTEKAESLRPSAIQAEEYKKKLETAMRLVTAQQREIDQLNGKFQQAGKEEARLKDELQKKSAEMQTAKLALEMTQRMLAQARKAG